MLDRMQGCLIREKCCPGDSLLTNLNCFWRCWDRIKLRQPAADKTQHVQMETACSCVLKEPIALVVTAVLSSLLASGLFDVFSSVNF